MIKQRSEQVFGGVMLIGLAVLFLTNSWWPGILFVVGAAMLARTVSEGHVWTSNRNAVAMLVIGVLFAFWDTVEGLVNFNILLPLVLIGAGIYLLFGNHFRGHALRSYKPKSDEFV